MKYITRHLLMKIVGKRGCFEKVLKWRTPMFLRNEGEI